MSGKLYPVPAGEWRDRAWLDKKAYDALYSRSVSDPEGFWGEIGRRLDWIKPYTQVKNTSFGPGDVSFVLVGLCALVLQSELEFACRGF